jgi:hypothetical protein
MTVKRDDLVAATDELEQALDASKGGRESGQDRRIGAALARVERAIREHAQTLEADGGGVVDIESPRVPSPAVDRQVDGLRSELDDLRREAGALRSRLTGGEAGERIPELSPFRQRVRRLVDSLCRYEEEEARVILESINTDVGAGD